MKTNEKIVKVGNVEYEIGIGKCCKCLLVTSCSIFNNGESNISKGLCDVYKLEKKEIFKRIIIQNEYDLVKKWIDKLNEYIDLKYIVLNPEDPTDDNNYLVNGKFDIKPTKDYKVKEITYKIENSTYTLIDEDNSLEEIKKLIKGYKIVQTLISFDVENEKDKK